MQAVKLRPYQSEAKIKIAGSFQAGARNVLAVLPTGAGKCLGAGTPVIMFDGSVKNVEDVKAGDLLMGPDSKPRRVLSTCSGREPLYRVVQKKGDPYVVNESHILSLKQTGIKSSPLYPCQMNKGRVVNIEVRDYLKTSKTFKHTHKGWKAPVSFMRSDLDPDLPPYLLGLWLGDGTSRGPSISSEDLEVAEYIRAYASKRGLNFRVEDQPGNASSVYHVTNEYKREGSLRTALKKYDLIMNKHIPHDYKTGSDQQRLELLAGIIDSDGSRSKSGFEITLKSRRLINDVVYVARSLGFHAGISEKIINGVTYYRSSINGGKYPIPVILDRKRPSKRTQIKDPLVTGIILEPLGVGDYYGFEIDGDRLFLLGDFTVTHNTVTFSDIMREHNGASCAIAHRQELVSQISIALARDGVRHRVIGPKNIVKLCVNLHVSELGVSFYDPAARCAVAGVDTLIRREKELEPWLRSVTLWVQDEAHHVLEGNKWGSAAKMFPNALGLGVTATPLRADGKGLGRHADGLFDDLVVGPGMRELIRAGYLTDYRIFAPPSNFVRPDTIGDSGDYSQKKMTAAVRGSQIVGDIVDHYLRIAPGKLGVTFVTDVETARDVAQKFNDASVPAAVVSAKTPDAERLATLRRFKNRELLQLVNVDLFGEGFDLPAIEVVSFGRPTESFGLYVQQFGRVLRLMLDGSLYPIWDEITAEQRRAYIAASTKPRGIIIDHVGNVTRHGLPDARREWTLDAREKRRKKDAPSIPVWTCLECLGVWERIHKVCQDPDCGAPMPPPASRSGPEFVDGDLLELDAETLAGLRGEVADVDKDPEKYREELAAKHVPHIGQLAHVKRHAARQAAQQVLRDSIALWGGVQRAAGRPDSESYRRFFFAFGVDVLSAQALNTKEALELNDRIRAQNGIN